MSLKNEIITDVAFRETINLDRRDALLKGAKCSVTGIVAPTLIGATALSVVKHAEAAIQTYYVNYDSGVRFKYEIRDGRNLYVSQYSGTTFIRNLGSVAIYGNGNFLITATNQSTRALSIDNDHRRLATPPAIQYPGGSTGRRTGANRCRTSFYGLYNIINAASVVTEYAIIYIYDAVQRVWDVDLIALSSAQNVASYQNYVSLVTTAAAYQNRLTGLTGAAGASYTAAAACAVSGLAPAAVAAGIAGIAASSLATYYNIKYAGALEALQNFRRSRSFDPV